MCEFLYGVVAICVLCMTVRRFGVECVEMRGGVRV